MDLWARGADRFLADRGKHDPARFRDVYYDDFVADPIGTVEGVYDHFGLTLTDAARTAMTSLHSESTSGAAKPVHKYTLDDFGLTADQVDERFADYRAAHFPGR